MFRWNILEIVLVVVVTANGQNKGPTGGSKSTSNIVANIRRQLMENNDDYVDSSSARIRAGIHQTIIPGPTKYPAPYSKRKLSILNSRTSKSPKVGNVYKRPNGSRSKSNHVLRIKQLTQKQKHPTNKYIRTLNIDSHKQYTQTYDFKYRQSHPKMEAQYLQKAVRDVLGPRSASKKIENLTDAARKSKRHKKLHRWSRAHAVPGSGWEKDGPYNDTEQPLSKQVHFRADDNNNNTGTRLTIIKLRKSGGRRSGGYRKLIKEESATGMSLGVLDDQPLPEFQLPSAWRQYMEGSHSHENLHELI